MTGEERTTTAIKLLQRRTVECDFEILYASRSASNATLLRLHVQQPVVALKLTFANSGIPKHPQTRKASAGLL